MSNFMAIIIARDKKRPATIEDGNTENMVFYTSEKFPHYSMGKNVFFIFRHWKKQRQVHRNQ